MTDPTPHISRRDALLAPLVGLAALSLYLLTLCPTIYVGDSGDMTNSAATLGVAHPTGYPLYVLLGKLFITLLPLGSVAFRANLFSAVAAAAAVSVAYLLLRRLQLARPASVGAALLIAFSWSFWSEAAVARVYTLQALLTFISLYLLFTWMENPSRTSLLWSLWFSIGLGLANHPATVSILPAVLLVFVVYSLKANLPAPRWALTPLAALPGLLLYLYVPLRAAMDPVVNWMGHPTWTNLRVYFLREQYWDRVYVTSPGRALQVFLHQLLSLRQEFTELGIILVLLGIVVLCARRRFLHLAILLSIFIFNSLALMLHGSIHDIFKYHRYLITGYTALALVAGVGLDWFCRREAGPPGCPHHVLRTSGAWVVALAAAGFVAQLHFHPADRSGNFLALDVNRAILQSLPPNAVLLTRNDEFTGPLIYLHEIEHLRPDVSVLPVGKQKDLSIPDPRQNEIFVTQPRMPSWPDKNLAQDRELRAEGLLYRVVTRKDPPPPLLVWEDYPVRGLDDPHLFLDDHSKELVSEYYRVKGDNFEHSDPELAVRAYLRSAEVALGHADSQFHTGDALLRMGRVGDAALHFARALKLDPSWRSEIDKSLKDRPDAPELWEKIRRAQDPRRNSH